MLVLTRRPGEQIVIGNGIRLTVVSVGPGRVKIGIEAPPDIRIDRQEIHAKIQQEQLEHSADVLATVGRTTETDELSPTIVASGDTSTQLHNRIAEKLPPSVAGGMPTVPVATQGSSLRRFPRKPR